MKQHWTIRIWNDGRYFDLWHLNHFLAGALLASLSIFLNLNFWLGFIISIGVLLAWELFEIVKNIKETFFNTVFDVIFGIVAFLIVYQLRLSIATQELLFWVVLVLWLTVELWGFYAYRVLTRT